MMENPQIWIPALVMLAMSIAFVVYRRGGVRGGEWTDIERLAVAPSVLILLFSLPLNHVWTTFWPGPATGRLALGRECWFLFWSLVATGAVAERLWSLFLKRRGRAMSMPGLLASILRGLYVLAVALFVLRYCAGWNITPVLASTALATAVIGFALQGVLGNLMAGISMNLVRTFRPGDWIAVRNIEGQVVHSDWRETRIRTTGLHMIVVPNSALAGELVTNFSQPDPLRRHEVFIATAFDAPPGQVAEALEAAAADVEGVVAAPPPQAHVYEFGEWSVRYRLFFHTREYQKRSRIEGEVRDRMWYELRRRGLKLPEVLLTGPGVSPPVLAAVQTVVPDISAAMLLDGDFGRRFLRDAEGRPWVTAEELQPVVARLRRLAYGPGEVIFRQGAAGGSCAILLSGNCAAQFRSWNVDPRR